MSDILKKPYDSIDLSLLIESFDETIGTLYPVAHVYGPDNVLITGSPFSLSLIGNNLYGLNSAFQANVDSGTYKVVYEVYTDAAHTIKSSQFGQKYDTITISIQASSGLGQGNIGGDVYVNFDPIIKILKDFENRFKILNKKVDSLQEGFDAGLKVDIPEIKAPEINIPEIKIPEFKQVDLKPIINLIQDLQQAQKGRFKDIMDGLKKNRSTIIKSKFDKTQMNPILKTVVESDLKIDNLFEDLKISLTKTIDMKNDKSSEKISKIFDESLEKNNKYILSLLNKLSNDVRIKLRFVVDQVKYIVLAQRPPKQNINITLKKDYEESSR